MVTLCTISLKLKILRSATVCLCVLCGSENKQQLFHSIALTDWFLQPRRSVFTKRYGLNIYIYNLDYLQWTLITETRARSQASPIEFCDGQSGPVTGFSPSTLFPPVSIFPPSLHTHSFTYHPRYIMFLSQYFSFTSQCHSTNVPCLSASKFCSCQKDKRMKPENLHTK